MRRFETPAVVLLAGIALAHCGEPFGPIDDLPRDLSSAELSLVEAGTKWALKLFREVSASDTSGSNLFISPLSVAMALGMTYNGADGTTRDQMAEALEVQNMTIQEVNEAFRDLIALLLDLDPKVVFQFANSIWYRDGITFEQAFLDTNREYFGAEIAPLDFSSPTASRTINDWVSDNTGGKIDKIVPDQIPDDLVMYLINAIYFKGDWAHQFDKGLTEDASFTLADGTEVLVPTMSHREEADVRRGGDDLFDVVDLPYGGGAFSMTILIPHSGIHIDSAAARLDEPRWQALVGNLGDAATVVALPKFTTEFEITLNDVLRALGMEDAFVEDVANFSKMRAENDLFISIVRHKTFVDVNEEGTEAAAATSVGITLTSAGPSVFRVDRPFVYVIRERFSGTIIFMGKMLDPRL